MPESPSADARVLLRTGAMLGVLYATVLAVGFLLGRVPRHRVEAAWYVAGVLAAVVLSWSAAVHPTVEWDRTEWSRARRAAAAAGLVALACVLYARAITVGLFSDDFVLLDRATRGMLDPGNEFVRPAPFAIWWVMDRAMGASPVLLHLLNILVHGLNGSLVLAIARELGLRAAWCRVAGVLFVVHAASVEPVVWISGLFDVLMTAGGLLSILGVLRGTPVTAWVGLALALLSKETGVAVPAIALGLAWASGRSMRMPIMAGVAAALFLLVRLWWLPPPEAYIEGPSRYLVKEMVTRAYGTLASPWEAGLTAAPLVLAALGTGAVGVMVARAVSSGASRAGVARGFAACLWVLLSVAPVYRYFYVTPEMAGARYLYLASAGWALLVAVLADQQSRGVMARRVATASVLLVLAANASALGYRVSAWREASLVRDRVLEHAAMAFHHSPCASVTVGQLPDAVKGVHVFLNGFAEAARGRGIDLPPVAADAECHFVWTPDGFVRVDRAVR